MSPPQELSFGDWDVDTASSTDVDISSDGDTFTLATTIPDSEDLHAHYDFPQEDGAMPVTDQTGNGYDLTDGSYTGVGTSINGVQAGDYDGTDDATYTSFSEVSQPTTVSLVIQLESTPGDFFDGFSGASELIRARDSTGNFGAFAGSNFDSTFSSDTNAHIITVLFNGASSVFRIDGQNVASGDSGTNGLDGVTLGSRGAGSQNHSDIRIGEVLVYSQDKSSIFGDIDSYLSDKWGIAV